MKITFEMEDEQVDAILVQEMKRNLESFERDLELRSDGEGLSIFDSDPMMDVLYIQEYINAFKLVLDYYGGNVD